MEIGNTIYIILGAFALGLLLGGFGTNKWEQEKFLAMQNAQQKAVIEAQTKSADKEHKSAEISTKVEKAYENAINNPADDGMHKNGNSPKQLPKISKSPGGINAACRLAKTRLYYLQNWIAEEVPEFNK